MEPLKYISLKYVSDLLVQSLTYFSFFHQVDHRVFGLQPDTMYDFVIMACNREGECQVSNQVTMSTERSAY